ncbi:MAG: glycosyltransferase family 1 protein, partial [Pseudorhodoplanes sp.]
VIGGENGFLIPPGDVDALVAALEPLMRDPQRAADIGRKARLHVLQYFGADAEAEKIAAVYREVLG